MTRLLIIEDSPTQAQQLVFILEDAGFRVEVVGDAERGFERLGEAHFDGVLTDLHLPGDSGFDLCRRVKADERYRHVPVVVLTSQADPANVLRGLEAGADGFLTKDHEPDEMAARIARLFTRPDPRHSIPSDDTRVAFMGQEFVLSGGRRQLVDVLVSAFEDVVHLNRRLRELAEDLARSARSERQAHDDLKRAESQLVHAEKLSSLGQMVAGVAHEINNPLAFVANNAAVLQRDVAALRTLVETYTEADDTLALHAPALRVRIQEQADRLDLGYTLGNLDSMLVRSREGLRRIQQIVKDLRDFARLDESDIDEVDLVAGIESTLHIIQGKATRQRVELVTELGPLPAVACYPANINQVVMNLVANAIDASPAGGKVFVRTRPVGDGVEIEVEDRGRGIDPAIRHKIFDPFFTTKPPGEGTGLGLSISYGIVQAHGGTITCDSAPGEGARFVVRLPLHGPAKKR